ncbi:hypothetical protein [Saccharopolyspora aridisoli]|nr:hypothetical protein [Saccharopolyspora aridisoli]
MADGSSSPECPLTSGEHERRPVREAELRVVQVDVPRAGPP